MPRKMTSRQAQALTMRYHKGMSFGQIGNEMGVSRQAAHKLVDKALNHISGGRKDPIRNFQDLK